MIWGTQKYRKDKIGIQRGSNRLSNQEKGRETKIETEDRQRDRQDTDIEDKEQNSKNVDSKQNHSDVKGGKFSKYFSTYY